jgi:hypothetical protein
MGERMDSGGKYGGRPIVGARRADFCWVWLEGNRPVQQALGAQGSHGEIAVVRAAASECWPEGVGLQRLVTVSLTGAAAQGRDQHGLSAEVAAAVIARQGDEGFVRLPLVP